MAWKWRGMSASGIAKSTDGRTRVIPRCIDQKKARFILMIYEQLTLGICQSVRCTAEDFLAKVSQLLESEEALKIQEELFSLRSCGWLKSDTLDLYSLRTSEDSSTTMGATPLKRSSEPWKSWGIASNGRCLTAEPLESLKIENECSLSDILEDSVDEQYFLSQKTIERLMSYKDTQIIP